MPVSPTIRSLVRSLAVAATAVLVLAATASAQRPQFQSRVELVQFQVRVTDGSGAFVPGLTVEDFRLEVDGAERPITTVYEVSLADEATDTRPADRPPAAWRQWILFFDAAFNQPRGVFAAQEAAREFVDNQAHERDLIGVATFNPRVGARMVVPPTRDRRQVREAIDGLGLNQATRNVDRAGFLAETIAGTISGEDPGGAGVADMSELLGEMSRQIQQLEFEQYASVVAQYTEALGGVGEILQQIRGRKHVVYFSRGFEDAVLTGQSLDDLAGTTDAMQQNAGLAIAESSGEDRFGSSEVRETLDDALESFRSADAVIHVIDPSGVGGGRDRTNIGNLQTGAGDFSARGGTRSALTALADATGGETYWESNDLAGAMADLEANNRSYYVIAFPRQADDDELLEIAVSANAAGATVDAPAELAAPTDFEEMSDLEKQIQIAEFVSKGIVESDMVFDVAAAGFYGDGTRNKLPVVVEIPWGQLEELANAGSDDAVQLEIYSYVLDDEERMVDLAYGETSLNMERARNSPASGLPFRFYDLLWADPGPRRVRVIVRDRELGRISAYTSPPTMMPEHASGEVSIAGPIGVDWDHPGLIVRNFDEASPPPHKANGPIGYPFMVGEEEITPSAALSGPPGSSHHAYFVAHNLGKDATGRAQTMVALGLDTPTGQMMPLAPDAQAMVATFYDPETDATQMVVRGTLPESLPTGQYGLVIMLEDRVKGARLSASVPIWVTE